MKIPLQTGLWWNGAHGVYITLKSHKSSVIHVELGFSTDYLAFKAFSYVVITIYSDLIYGMNHTNTYVTLLNLSLLCTSPTALHIEICLSFGCAVALLC